MSPRKKRRLHRKAANKQRKQQRWLKRWTAIAGYPFPCFIGRDIKGQIRI